MEIKNLSESLTKTISESNISDLSIDLFESTLDSSLKDGIIKEIPIFKTFFVIRRGYLSIQDQLFIRKLVAFLNKSKDVDLEERKLMIKKINKCKKYKTKVGEKLLFIIDKANDSENAEICSIFFNSFLKGVISYEMFLRIIKIIQSVSYDDLKDFCKKPLHKSYEYYPDNDTNSLLFSNGLLQINIDAVDVKDESDWKVALSSKYNVSGGEVFYTLSEAGKEIMNSLKNYFSD